MNSPAETRFAALVESLDNGTRWTTLGLPELTDEQIADAIDYSPETVRMTQFDSADIAYFARRLRAPIDVGSPHSLSSDRRLSMGFYLGLMLRNAARQILVDALTERRMDREDAACTHEFETRYGPYGSDLDGNRGTWIDETRCVKCGEELSCTP